MISEVKKLQKTDTSGEVWWTSVTRPDSDLGKQMIVQHREDTGSNS